MGWTGPLGQEKNDLVEALLKSIQHDHQGTSSQMMNDPANPTPVRLGMDTAAEYDSSTYLSWVEIAGPAGVAGINAYCLSWAVSIHSLALEIRRTGGKRPLSPQHPAVSARMAPTAGCVRRPGGAAICPSSS